MQCVSLSLYLSIVTPMLTSEYPRIAVLAPALRVPLMKEFDEYVAACRSRVPQYIREKSWGPTGEEIPGLRMPLVVNKDQLLDANA